MIRPCLASVLVRVSTDTRATGMEACPAVCGIQSEQRDMLATPTDEDCQMDEGVPMEPMHETGQATAPYVTQVIKKTKTKRVRPMIDLDDHIRKAQDAIKQARKQVQTARMQAKLEKRKNTRLMRKASSLNIEDLERISVLKRCGLIQAAAAPHSEECAAGAPAAAATA